jgi:hypothetical protein
LGVCCTTALNVSADNEHMRTGLSYTVVQWTQHYRVIDGVWHRDAVARRADGALRLVAFPEGGAR